jgi:hypothetical protein
MKTPTAGLTAASPALAQRLSGFRAKVDLRPCTPTSDAPSWLQELTALASVDLGVLALLGPSGLTVRGSDGVVLRLRPDTAELCIVALAHRIESTPQSLAISCPPTARHFPLLFVGAAALRQTLQQALSPDDPASGGVLLVSTDLEVRSRYCDLYVSNQQIDSAYPGSRLRPQGDVVSLTAGREVRSNRGVCFYLPYGGLPERLACSPGLIVLDLRYGRTPQPRMRELLQWVQEIRKGAGVLALYSCADLDTRRQLLDARFLDFPFDHVAVDVCSDYTETSGAPVEQPSAVRSSFTAAPENLIRRHSIVEVENCDELEQLFEQTGQLLDSSDQSDSLDFARARWVFATLRQLPVPITWYEQTAYSLGRATLKRLIDRIGVISRHEHGVGPTLQSLRIQLTLLYRQLELSNPRAASLRSQVQRIASSHGQKTLLLVRDRTMERAVRSWIDLDAHPGAEWLDRVEVVGCQQFSKIAEERFSYALINGALPRRHRWIMGSALADSVLFLTYPHESDIVEKQLQAVYSDASRAASTTQRYATLARLNDRAIARDVTPDEAVSPLHLVRPKKRSGTHKERTLVSVRSLADLSQAVELSQENKRLEAQLAGTLDESWRSDSVDEDQLDDVNAAEVASGVESVTALRVHVNSTAHGRGYLWLQAGEPVECVRLSSPDDLTMLPPEELAAGDVILRMAEGGRTDLFDRIVELAEGQPEMAYLARFRQAWRDAVQGLAHQHVRGQRVDYESILTKLQRAGATIQSALTVRFWVEGYVIGPEDPRSVEAVGSVAGAEGLVRNAKNFDKAFRRIRGLRQGIGRRLNTAIRRQFKDFAAGTAKGRGEVIDGRLGIPLEEIIETIDLAEVVSVSHDAVIVGASQLLRFNRN